MPIMPVDSFNTQTKLDSKKGIFIYSSLKVLEYQGIGDTQKLPHLLKLLLENLLQFEDDKRVNKLDIKALTKAGSHISKKSELAFHPVRVRLEKISDTLSLATLAAYCSSLRAHSNNPKVKVDWGVLKKGLSKALLEEVKKIPNLQSSSNLPFNWLHFRKQPEGGIQIFQESLVGTGNGIAEANALGILALNVSSLAAESVMLNEPVYLSVPDILGIKFEGSRNKNIHSEIYVVNILQQLKEENVAGRWLEFYGNGLDQLSYQERVSISEGAMALGAVCAFFPVDQKILQQISKMLQDPEMVELIQAYILTQGLWRDNTTSEPVFNDSLSLDFSQLALETLERSIQKPELNSAIKAEVKILPIELPSLLPEMEQFYLKQIKCLFSEQLVESAPDIHAPFVMITHCVNNLIFADGITRNTVLGSMQVILAKEFEPIMRADLIRLGIMPLLFKFGMSRDNLQIEGGEYLDFVNLSRQMKPGMDVLCRMTRKSGDVEEFVLKCGIETARELEYFRCGGVLGYVLGKEAFKTTFENFPKIAIDIAETL